MSNAETVVRDFLSSLGGTDYQKTRAAFEEALTEDCVWANTGFPAAEGKAACVALFDAFNAASGFVGITVDWVACAANGDTVVTERVDHLIDPTGKVIVTLVLAGTLVVRDGKIAAWRDYFDPRPLLG